MGSWFFLSVPAELILGSCGIRKEAKYPAGQKSSASFKIRLARRSFQKILAVRQAQSPRQRESPFRVPKTQSAFFPLAEPKRFPSRRASTDQAQTPSGFLEMSAIISE
jgi:hypothetical protein